jgi:hypothetical protein
MAVGIECRQVPLRTTDLGERRHTASGGDKSREPDKSEGESE